MFAVAWPVGLILLLSKLSEGGGRKMRQQAREAWQRTAAGSAEAKPAQARASAAKNTVRKVTETPNYSDKGAKTMKIIGAVVGILGCVAMLSAVSDNLSYAYHYNEWWYFARQLFYPMGMMAGGCVAAAGQRRHEAPPAAVRHLSAHGGAEGRRAAGLSGKSRPMCPGSGWKRTSI